MISYDLRATNPEKTCSGFINYAPGKIFLGTGPSPQIMGGKAPKASLKAGTITLSKKLKNILRPLLKNGPQPKKELGLTMS